MPTISVFYGLVIQMYFHDHLPPHFHVRYAEFKATIEFVSRMCSLAACRPEP
jgi:hypothetical protein